MDLLGILREKVEESIKIQNYNPAFDVIILIL